MSAVKFVMVLMDLDPEFGCELARISMLDYMFNDILRTSYEEQFAENRQEWVPCAVGYIISKITNHDEYVFVSYKGGEPIPEGLYCTECGGPKPEALPYCSARCFELAEELSDEDVLLDAINNSRKQERARKAKEEAAEVARVVACPKCDKHDIHMDMRAVGHGDTVGEWYCYLCELEDPRA